jgi:hypothetical protein
MAAGVAVTWATAPAGSGTEKSGRDGVAAIAPPGQQGAQDCKGQANQAQAVRAGRFDALDAASGS